MMLGAHKVACTMKSFLLQEVSKRGIQTFMIAKTMNELMNEYVQFLDVPREVMMFRDMLKIKEIHRISMCCFKGFADKYIII